MSIEIQTLRSTLGAVVRGVALETLADKDWRQIYEAFLEHAVLIFPGQRLSDRQQEAFATRFGTIENLVEGLKTIPITNKTPEGAFYEENSDRMKLLRGNEGWHTDSSYMPLTAKVSVLSAHVVPKNGGETEWADMRAAYNALDEETKSIIRDLNAYHSYFQSQAKLGHVVEAGAAYGFFEGETPLHPLVKVHPETGRPALFIGRHACVIPGLSTDAADALLDRLVTFACQKPRLLRHNWQEGDLVVWDNRCLLHRARPYNLKDERLMLHTRIAGDPRTESAINA